MEAPGRRLVMEAPAESEEGNGVGPDVCAWDGNRRAAIAPAEKARTNAKDRKRQETRRWNGFGMEDPN